MVRMPPCHLALGETGSISKSVLYFYFMYYVYMLESLADGDFYKGSTTDYLKRGTGTQSGREPIYDKQNALAAYFRSGV